MKTAQECLCCSEYPEIKTKLREVKEAAGNKLKCVLDHPALQSVVLDPWVLQRSWIQHNKQFKDLDFAGQQASKYRAMARHQFVMWYWGFLSRGANRLPSCVASIIDESYTPEIIEKNGYPKLD